MSPALFYSRRSLLSYLLNKIGGVAERYEDLFVDYDGNKLVLTNREDTLKAQIRFSDVLDMVVTLVFDHILSRRQLVVHTRRQLSGMYEQHVVPCPKRDREANASVFRALDDIFETVEDLGKVQESETGSTFDYTFTDLDYFMTSKAGEDYFFNVTAPVDYVPLITRLRQNHFKLQLTQEGTTLSMDMHFGYRDRTEFKYWGSQTALQTKVMRLCGRQWEESSTLKGRNKTLQDILRNMVGV